MVIRIKIWPSATSKLCNKTERNIIKYWGAAFKSWNYGRKYSKQMFVWYRFQQMSPPPSSSSSAFPSAACFIWYDQISLNNMFIPGGRRCPLPPSDRTGSHCLTSCWSCTSTSRWQDQWWAEIALHGEHLLLHTAQTCRRRTPPVTVHMNVSAVPVEALKEAQARWQIRSAVSSEHLHLQPRPPAPNQLTADVMLHMTQVKLHLVSALTLDLSLPHCSDDKPETEERCCHRTFL